MNKQYIPYNGVKKVLTLNDIAYVPNVLNKDWASKGGTEAVLNPQSVWSKLFIRTLQEDKGVYGTAYQRRNEFTSGQATAVSYTFNRMNPIVLRPVTQEITHEGKIPPASKTSMEQFSLTAKTFGAWVQYTDQSDLTDYYGLGAKVPTALITGAVRMEDTRARDKLVTRSTKTFMPQDNGNAADKTNTGYFRFGVIMKKYFDLKNAGYDVSQNKLFISEEIYAWLRFSDNSKIAKTLERSEMTLGLSARWYTNFNRPQEINLLGINLNIVKSPAYTYGNAVGVGGNNEKRGTNIPIQWTGNAGVNYQVGTGADNEYLECSIFVVGDSAYSLMVLDQKTNTGIEAIMVSELGSAGANDPLRQLGAYAVKWWSGYEVIDSYAVTSYFSKTPDIVSVFEV